MKTNLVIDDFTSLRNETLSQMENDLWRQLAMNKKLITQNFYYEIVRVKCAILKLGGKL